MTVSSPTAMLRTTALLNLILLRTWRTFQTADFNLNVTMKRNIFKNHRRRPTIRPLEEVDDVMKSVEKGITVHLSSSEMQIAVALVSLFSLLSLISADVVTRFEDVPECMEYFYRGMVPKWGAATPDVARICQRFVNRYHFATLYDTHHRIAVYSAYHFQPSNGGGREKRWFVEPQLVNSSWQAGMKDSYWLGKDHPGVYQGERQALNEDYTHSGFNRGHLNPNGHHAVPSRNATFTLTNVVPQNAKLNQNAWRMYEAELTDLFRAKCSKAYVLVGAVPSSDKWIGKNQTKRVNVPDYLWNAYCCVDNNSRPVQSGGGSARNTEDNWVERHSLDELVEFLQQFTNEPVGELFYNNCI